MNISNSRSKILQIRSSYLQNDSNAFKGNNKNRTDYLNQLNVVKPQLTKFQIEYVIGLNLGALIF